MRASRASQEPTSCSIRRGNRSPGSTLSISRKNCSAPKWSLSVSRRRPRPAHCPPADSCARLALSLPVVSDLDAAPLFEEIRERLLLRLDQVRDCLALSLQLVCDLVLNRLHPLLVLRRQLPELVRKSRARLFRHGLLIPSPCCPNGHPPARTKSSSDTSPASATAAGGHTSWHCRTCDALVYGSPLNTHCTALDGPAAVRISNARALADGLEATRR
jgi:hypothetical protein